ncbi:hypothetical protein DCCM_4037 [Desulfocucumis palustris]|uniref:Uncharacterized protein n=1 Tax=Desulfocucumis palustris TaxID=1898651 RepID=A0A2L2XEZ6_9FIRM|nr:hypothetical protein [Desulfocucumis palustris]GBF34917.1 hypothetical protein DCCM_4037 [Desulfocucumis palustris]
MDYQYAIQKIAEMIFNHGEPRRDDFDDCLDYADSVYQDLGAGNIAQYAGLLFIETDETIEIKKQSDGSLVGSIDMTAGKK